MLWFQIAAGVFLGLCGFAVLVAGIMMLGDHREAGVFGRDKEGD